VERAVGSRGCSVLLISNDVLLWWQTNNYNADTIWRLRHIVWINISQYAEKLVNDLPGLILRFQSSAVSGVASIIDCNWEKLSHCWRYFMRSFDPSGNITATWCDTQAPPRCSRRRKLRFRLLLVDSGARGPPSGSETSSAPRQVLLQL
jgi:hypothetical protein